jgi:hypothetical protein
MTGWKVVVPISSVLLALALAQACSTGEPRDERAAPRDEAADERELEQHADGCGAQRYRGIASIECLYQGDLAGSVWFPTGTCTEGDEDRITCSYPLSCQWKVAMVTTTCVEQAGKCSEFPPVTTLIHPAPVVLTLPEGSQLCVKNGSTASERGDYCYANRGNYRDDARTACEGQFDQHTGETSCCLSCISPAPRALDAACAEVPDGGPIDAGPDATPDATPDAAIDATPMPTP